jgi:hypothetical protein
VGERPDDTTDETLGWSAVPADSPAALEARLAGREVYWFVGGPLDGRVLTRPCDDPAPPVVRHTHLHEGPKIVHLYDLRAVAGHGGEYRLRDEPPA